jgi:hypothetical protein
MGIHFKLFLLLLVFGTTDFICAAEDDARPNEHLSPISLNVMRDPVVADDGHTYERVEITQWFNQRVISGLPVTSPKTGAVLRNTNLTSNYALKALIDDWKEPQTTPTSDIPFFNPSEYPFPGENYDDSPGKCKGMCIGIRSLLSS